eukprot:jgi/Undpi1/1163/HiC_scaffold_10.g04625.m1
MATTPSPSPPPPPPPQDDAPAPLTTAVSAPQDQKPESNGQESKPGTSSAASKKKKKKKKKGGGGGGGGIGSPQAAAGACRTYYRKADTFLIKQDAVAGRCVVAKRDLQPGELVSDEPPFAKVYCSRACKSREDALRSAEAGALSKLEGISIARDIDLDLLRMMLRLVIMRATALGLRPENTQKVDGRGSGEDQEHKEAEAGGEGPLLLQQWRNLHSLMHHRETMSASWITVAREAAEDLTQIVPDWARLEVGEVVELACRVNVNAHGFGDDFKPNSVIGVGMFPLLAMVNHACRPNCTFVYYGGKLTVRTLEGVPAGSELCVCYIDLLQPKVDRRQELLATKHFVCACSRCDHPDPVDSYLDGVCCPDCGPNACLASTPPPSPEDVIAAQLAELGRYTKGKTCLGPRNRWKNGWMTTMQVSARARQLVSSLIYSSCAQCDTMETDPVVLRCRYIRRAVSAMEGVYPPNHPELGDIYVALADAISVFVEKRGQTLPTKAKSQSISEQKQALERAAAIRSVCMGKDHPTTAEAKRALARV